MQHLTLKQLRELTHDAAAVAAVEDFLAGFPLVSKRSTINEEFISVMVTVDVAQQMLGAEYFEWVHEAKGVTLHRVSRYSLPSSVASAVDFVAHTTALPNLSRPPLLTSFHTSAAAGNSTPEVISTYYGIANNTVSNVKSTNCVFETIGQSYAPADLSVRLLCHARRVIVW